MASKIDVQFTQQYQDIVTEILDAGTYWSFAIIDVESSDKFEHLIKHKEMEVCLYPLNTMQQMFIPFANTKNLNEINGIFKYLASQGAHTTQSFKNWVYDIFGKPFHEVSHEDIMEELKDICDNVYLEERNEAVMQIIEERKIVIDYTQLY